MSLVLNPATGQQLTNFINKPAHALLLLGPKGSGKSAIVNHVLATIFRTEGLESHPYGKFVRPEAGKSLGIEAVRELEHFLALKVPNNQQVNRFIVFEEAGSMTSEAQNALLKTLEEPPAGSIIIMTAANAQNLLPTIQSRAQTIKVIKPDVQQLSSHFSAKGYSARDVNKAISISGGLPGLAYSLLSEEEHQLTAATTYARQLLSKNTYEKLLTVEDLSKNKQLSLDVCYILQQMAHISLQKASGPVAKKWQTIMQSAYEASVQLQKSGQPKLVLDNLMLHL